MATRGAAGSAGTTFATGSTRQMSFAAWIYNTGDVGTNPARILDFGRCRYIIFIWTTPRKCF